ncbi:pregnancy zone protein-like, partial [Otolemur garnettii]|uniref:pregnancy zone protein-like n=1 Tax=Otolemur garnettii TaxID=30611 RepID=UPI000C7F2C65
MSMPVDAEDFSGPRGAGAIRAPVMAPMMAPGMAGAGFQNVPVKEIVRKYFPETWIWDLVELDLSGGKELEMKVPDTITEWKASAFCLSETTGLGLSPVVPFQVFQPFFLELSLPYSVVRGEAFTLKATVSNYLSHCIRVNVQLETSSAFLDTVVALQALSKYGAATFTKNEKAALVTVKSSDAFSKEFQVDDANRLLLQEVRLPEIPGEYNTTVSGSGCVYLQLQTTRPQIQRTEVSTNHVLIYFEK